MDRLEQGRCFCGKVSIEFAEARAFEPPKNRASEQRAGSEENVVDLASVLRKSLAKEHQAADDQVRPEVRIRAICSPFGDRVAPRRNIGLSVLLDSSRQPAEGGSA